MTKIQPIFEELAAETNYKEFIARALAIYNTVVSGLLQAGKTMPKELMARLSAREKNVTKLAVEGWSNREIGNHLDVAEITIKKALQSIYKKLGISRRTELVKIILQNK